MTDDGTQAELERLRKRAEREHRARLEAESLAERGTRQLYERQLQVQLLHVIAVAANEAASVEDAVQVALERICAYARWPVGHAYLVAEDQDPPLVSTALWHSDHPRRFAEFRRITEATSFRRGEGLPGRIHESGAAAWIPDVTLDANFPRAKCAVDIGVRGAFGFPVLAGADVVAVLEFFSPDSAEPDTALLEIVAQVGTQLGRVFERQLAARQLAAAHEQLEEHAARLKASNRELEEFAYVASHDLQEPLRKVQAFGERLKDACGDRLEGRAVDYLDRMQTAAARMQRLIGDLLTFSRVTSRKEAYNRTDLNTVVGGVLSDLYVRINELDAQVNVDPLPTIDADATQMQQLFQNLIGNALKFSKAGEPPRIRVRAAVVENTRGVEVSVPGPCREQGYVEISVQDRGIGFDSKYTEKIFAVFQRLHGRTEYEGTGVGLAVCKKVVERHGGGIRAQSEPGAGATFTVVLPLRQAPAQPEIARAAAVEEVTSVAGGAA